MPDALPELDPDLFCGSDGRGPHCKVRRNGRVREQIFRAKGVDVWGVTGILTGL